jgi:hypothetical protein
MRQKNEAFKSFEDVREVGASVSFQVDHAQVGKFGRLTTLLPATRQPVEMSSNRPGY